MCHHIAKLSITLFALVTKFDSPLQLFNPSGSERAPYRVSISNDSKLKNGGTIENVAKVRTMIIWRKLLFIYVEILAGIFPKYILWI